MTHPRRVLRALALIALLCAVCVMHPAAAAASPRPVATDAAPADATHVGATREAAAEWEWPVAGPREVVAPFRAPAHAYGAGHRGLDIAPGTGAVLVMAPADGVVAFRGTVVDRALLTIEHPGGLVSTFEPVLSALSPGDSVVAGQKIGDLSLGGHTDAGALHLGVRLDGEYINPMLLFGGVPRAVLLPCCD